MLTKHSPYLSVCVFVCVHWLSASADNDTVKIVKKKQQKSEITVGTLNCDPS